MTSIKQQVLIQEDGRIEVRSSELRIGETVEVVVRITPQKQKTQNDDTPKPSWRDFIGAFGPGGGTSDNESIDRDLAKEYGDDHDPLKQP